ncbi:MAG: cation:proton antiporter [Candidatus Rokubacteria bacterium]|nr:cation:proton antiporter [Candidatus Rokubacteria bacterium]
MAEPGFLRDLVVLLVLSLGIAFAFQRLGQPPLVGFLAAGVVIGPHGLSFVREIRQVELLAEVGVVLLLFTLGIEFSLAALVQLRRQVVVGGSLQIGLTILLTVPLALSLGGWHQALLIGALVAHSSSVIGLKLLMGRGEIDAPHGRSVLGILIFQDLLVIPMILAVPLLSGQTAPRAGVEIVRFVGSLVMVAAILLAARWLVPRFLEQVVRMRHRELFVLTLVLICLGTAWLGNRVGLSLALGAFLAGVAVSESEYGTQALADVVPLRDTFSSLFFISIGMLLDLGFVARHPSLVAGAVAAVLTLKLLTGVAAVLGLGLGLRTALLGGIVLAQVGELSFVLAQAGVAYRLLTTDLYQLFLSVAVTSMFVTPFLFAAAYPLADRVLAGHVPRWLESARRPLREEPEPPGDHVVIAGYGVNGRNLARVLRAVEIPYVVADTNPERVWQARADGEPVLYGDVSRPDVLERLRLDRARALVLAISDAPSTRRAVSIARGRWPHLTIVARTRYLAEVDGLYRLGATEVVPEEFETSVEIFARVLATYDVPRALVAQQIERVRREHYAVWRDSDLQAQRLGRLRTMLAGLDVESYRVTERSFAREKSLAELDLRRASGATVIALVRGGVTQANPGGAVRVEAGDTLVLLGTNAQVERALGVLDPR